MQSATPPATNEPNGDTDSERKSADRSADDTSSVQSSEATKAPSAVTHHGVQRANSADVQGSKLEVVLPDADVQSDLGDTRGADVVIPRYTQRSPSISCMEVGEPKRFSLSFPVKPRKQKKNKSRPASGQMFNVSVPKLLTAMKKSKKRDSQVSTDSTFTLDPTQARWNELSTYLQTLDLRSIPKLPHVIDVPRNPPQLCPALGDVEEDMIVDKIEVVKRFKSRKVPHMIAFMNAKGKRVEYIFKQDDDLNVDVAIMQLLTMSNAAWLQTGAVAHHITYDVQYCPDRTGFVEVVPGKTILKLHAKEMDDIIAGDTNRWCNFYRSMVAVIVVTCAYGIMDRHHNNVLMTPEGQVVLLDLSASLGKKTVVDSVMDINPIYFPDRFRKLTDMMKAEAAEACKHGDCCNSPDCRQGACVYRAVRSRWSDLEADCMHSYYTLYNNREIEVVLEEAGYRMPKAKRFLNLLLDRKHLPQFNEKLRNDIVSTMDKNETVNKMVASFTSALNLT